MGVVVSYFEFILVHNTREGLRAGWESIGRSGTDDAGRRRASCVLEYLRTEPAPESFGP